MECIASYFDGSGQYNVFLEGDKLTIKLSDNSGNVMEEFPMVISRARFFDGTNWDNYRLTDRFAFSEDEEMVEIDGLSYKIVG